MSILSEYLSAWLGTDVTEHQAQALQDATTAEQAIAVIQTMRRPVTHAPILPKPEYIETLPPSDAPTGYGTDGGEGLVHERKSLTR